MKYLIPLALSFFFLVCTPSYQTPMMKLGPFASKQDCEQARAWAVKTGAFYSNDVSACYAEKDHDAGSGQK